LSGGLAKIIGRRCIIIRTERKQSEIERVIVLVGIKFRRPAKIGHRRRRFVLTLTRQCEIVQDFRQVRAGNEVGPQSFLQGHENFFGLVRLIHQQPANARGENRLDIAVMRFRDFRKPDQRRVAVPPRVVGVADREIRIGPIRIEPRSFSKFAQPRIILAGQQTANVVFERIEPQRPLSLREFFEASRVGMVVRG
jgi:hypothetical protein